MVLGSALALAACDNGGATVGPAAGDRDGGGGAASSGADGGTTGGDGNHSGPIATGSPVTCFQTVNGIAVVEAEGLPITEMWRVANANTGFTGAGYIEWAGSSFNNNTTNGRFSVTLRLAAAGRYKLQWYTRIGRGNNATEHNDTWLKVADADGFYGIKGPDNNENRVYPKPRCEDNTFMSRIRSMANIANVKCPNGSTRDGYFKVYSSGAQDWKWSARTSDNDAHDIIIEVNAPGDVTLDLAARADFSQIDRIVVHEEALNNNTVRDLALAETPCR